MTRERAIINALEIIDICRTYGDEDRCKQCPFNIKGCILTDGNNIPIDWRVSDIVTIFEMKGENK